MSQQGRLKQANKTKRQCTNRWRCLSGGKVQGFNKNPTSTNKTEHSTRDNIMEKKGGQHQQEILKAKRREQGPLKTQQYHTHTPQPTTSTRVSLRAEITNNKGTHRTKKRIRGARPHKQENKTQQACQDRPKEYTRQGHNI